MAEKNKLSLSVDLPQIIESETNSDSGNVGRESKRDQQSSAGRSSLNYEEKQNRQILLNKNNIGHALKTNSHVLESVVNLITDALRILSIDILNDNQLKLLKEKVYRFIESIDIDSYDIKKYVSENFSEFDEKVQDVIVTVLKRKVPYKLRKLFEDEDSGMLKSVEMMSAEELETEISKIQEKLLLLEAEEEITELKTITSLAKKMDLPIGSDLIGLKEQLLSNKLSEEDVEKLEEIIRLEYIVKFEPDDWSKVLSGTDLEVPIVEELRGDMEDYIEKRKKRLWLKIQEEEARRVLEEVYKSEESNNLTVTIKFTINTGDIFTSAYTLNTTVWDIKEDLAGVFRVPAEVLVIRDNEGIETSNHMMVRELDVDLFQSVELTLQTTDFNKYPLENWQVELPIPDVITVTVEVGRDEYDNPRYKEIVVEIIDRKIRKPFVGGFRDPKTGLEYHNAFTQSAPHLPTLPVEKRNHRDTQTTVMKKQMVETVSHKGTQISSQILPTDQLITPKRYVDHEETEKERDIEGNVRTIQRYFRVYLLKKHVKEKSQEYRLRKSWEDEQNNKRSKEREEKVKRDLINMTFPKTKADFDMLYGMVERWRKAQVLRISQLKTDAPKKAEFCALLEKEIKLLESIESHRINVLKEKRKKKDLQFMEKVSKPIQWTGYRGMKISMDTIQTQRARELKKLYTSLQNKDVTLEKRIEILMSLKYALKIYNTKLTDEIQELVNKECDLLIRGVKQSKLDFLRKRIEGLFVEFFKKSEFNTEAKKYLPENRKDEMRNNVITCRLCKTMKLKKSFCIHACQSDVTTCSSCTWTKNISYPRINLDPYRRILRQIRREEQKQNCYSSSAFILQEEDVYFLINNIWHSASAISGSDDLFNLRLPRWKKCSDWTPWNCILLTEAEVKNHLKLDDVLQVYEESFIQSVSSKHLLAKNHFKRLIACDKRMRNNGVWSNVGQVKEYVQTSEFNAEEL